jgi:hypothetical protein
MQRAEAKSATFAHFPPHCAPTAVGIYILLMPLVDSCLDERLEARCISLMRETCDLCHRSRRKRMKRCCGAETHSFHSLIFIFRSFTGVSDGKSLLAFNSWAEVLTLSRGCAHSHYQSARCSIALTPCPPRRQRIFCARVRSQRFGCAALYFLVFFLATRA